MDSNLCNHSVDKMNMRALKVLSEYDSVDGMMTHFIEDNIEWKRKGYCQQEEDLMRPFAFTIRVIRAFRTFFKAPALSNFREKRCQIFCIQEINRLERENREKRKDL